MGGRALAALALLATLTSWKVPPMRVAEIIVDVTDPEPGPAASLRFVYH